MIGKDISKLEVLMEQCDLTRMTVESTETHVSDEVIKIDLANFTEDDIYRIAATFSIGNEIKGSQGTQSADNSVLRNGEIISFTFLPEDFGIASTDGQTITLNFSVYDKNNTCYDVTGEVSISSEYGTCYLVNLSGNATEGYQITH